MSSMLFSGVVIRFTSEVVTVAEDGGNAVLTVVLTGALQGNVTITFTTIPDSATGRALILSTNCCINILVKHRIKRLLFKISRLDIHAWSEFSYSLSAHH